MTIELQHQETSSFKFFMSRVFAWAARPSSIFLLFSLLFGAIFAIAIPPGYNPDEPHHFFRAYQIADGQLFSYGISHDDLSDLVDRPGETVGGSIPKNVALLFATTNTWPIAGSGLAGQQRPNSIDWQSAWQLHEGTATISVGFSNTAVYSPLVYAPTVAAIELGRLVNAPLLLVFWLARAFNLLVGVLLTYFAIKMLPIGRWTLMVIALLPTTIVEMSAVSGDPVTLALGFLSISLSLRFALQKTPLNRRQWLSLFFVMLGIGLAKPLYAILLGSALAIPILNRAMRTWRRMLTLLAVLVAAGIPAIFWQFAVRNIPPSFQTVEKVQTQTAYIISDPLHNIATLVITFFTDFGQGRFFYQSFFGSFAWNGVFLPTIFIFALCGALVVSTFLRDPGERLFISIPNRERRWAKAGFLSLFVLGCLAVAEGLYTVWADPQSTVVTGMQGRYFIPFAFALFIPLIGASLHRQKGAKIAVVSTSLVSLMAGVGVTIALLYLPALPNAWL